MRRENFKREEINVKNINLNLENPRLSNCNSESDCLRQMLEGIARSKNLKLAKHIAESGLSIEPIVVMKNGHSWVVHDGNRRIAALKMLNNPAICPDESSMNYFYSIKNNPDSQIPKTIGCEVAQELKDVTNYINLKHKGEQGGVGQVPWKPYIASKNSVLIGESASYEKATKLAMWGEKERIVTSPEEFPVAVLDLLTSSSEILDIIGINFSENNEIEFINDKNKSKTNLTNILHKLNNGEIKRGDFRNIEQSKEFIKNNILDTPYIIPEVENKPTIQPRKPRSTNKKSWIRNASFIQYIPEDSKERQIAEELSDKHILNVEKAPNAVSILARTFIELSLKHYITNNIDSGITISNSVRLNDLVNKVITNQKQSNLINEEEEERYKRAFNDYNMQAIKSLHSYVHSRHYHPSPATLYALWGNIKGLIINCWKN